MSLSSLQKYQRKKLRTDLSKLMNFLNRSYQINYGGCCWVTYCLAKNFERLNMEFRLVVYDDYPESPEETYLNIVERNENTFPCGFNTAAHYTLKVRGLGLINGGEGEFVTVEGISSEDIKWIYDTGDWNSDYNSRLNEEIKNLIDTVFRIYEEESCTREVA